jgi:hypothetical protein
MGAKTMPITYSEMLHRYRTIADKADAIAKQRQRAGRRAAELAGVGNNLGTAGHNAMIAYREGRPWAEINYSQLRRALRLMRRSFEPTTIAQRAWTRLYDEWRLGGFKH